MRPARLIPPALIAGLALAVPAAAEDQSISVADFQFTPKNVSVDPGDTVKWNFQGPTEHTSTSKSGQAEKWTSGLKGEGGSFSHKFTHPGKYQFFCQPHPFMTGAVTVGHDAVAKSFTSVKARGGTRSVKVTVKLKEAAKLTVSAKGRKKATRRLKKGKHTVKLTKLPSGRYKVSVTAQDDFDKKTKKKVTASVR